MDTQSIRVRDRIAERESGTDPQIHLCQQVVIFADEFLAEVLRMHPTGWVKYLHEAGWTAAAAELERYEFSSSVTLKQPEV